MSSATTRKPTHGGFFITGTDTDAGKTYVTACLALTLIERGYRVSARKPVASGCIPQPDGELACADALTLQAACGHLEPLTVICPYRFTPPISPQRAIQQAGLFISTQTLAKACAPGADCWALVEGAGGFYSPLSSDGLNADLAQQLNYPVILVVGNRLGCLNHALLTLEAIAHRGLVLHSVIVNDLSAHADAANFTDLAAQLAARAIHCYHLPFAPDGQPRLIQDFVL